MCVKLPPRDLNPGPCPPHPTSTYTCGVTIAPRVCGGTIAYYILPSNYFLWGWNEHGVTAVRTKIKRRIQNFTSLFFSLRVNCVEVGRVWLELPSPIHYSKPNTSSIRKPNSTRIIIPSTSRPTYIYILGLWYLASCEN